MFMSRRSCLANTGITCLVLLTMAVTEYVRCTEDSGSLLHKHGIEVGEPVDGASEHESLHCPTGRQLYAVGRRAIETQRFSAGQEPVSEIDGVLNTNDDSFIPENLEFPAMFPYRLVPLYQFTVVYRI